MFPRSASSSDGQSAGPMSQKSAVRARAYACEDLPPFGRMCEDAIQPAATGCQRVAARTAVCRARLYTKNVIPSPPVVLMRVLHTA